MIHLVHLSCDSSKRPADGSKEYLKPILRLNWVSFSHFVIVCYFRGNFFASNFIIINDCFHILGCFFCYATNYIGNLEKFGLTKQLLKNTLD